MDFSFSSAQNVVDVVVVVVAIDAHSQQLETFQKMLQFFMGRTYEIVYIISFYICIDIIVSLSRCLCHHDHHHRRCPSFWMSYVVDCRVKIQLRLFFFFSKDFLFSLLLMFICSLFHIVELNIWGVLNEYNHCCYFTIAATKSRKSGFLFE